MAFEVGIADSSEQRAAVQRLRYAIYVEELGRYLAAADHATRLLADPEDEYSWLFYALDGGEVVASTRVTWGGEADFSSRQVEQYSLEPFLAEIPKEMIAVGERTMVRPDHRGSGALDELMALTAAHTEAHDLRVCFGACEPHLLSLYIGMGQQPYADRNINSEEAGYLIPLVSFLPDAEALRGVGDSGDALPAIVQKVVGGGGGAVTSGALATPENVWQVVHGALGELDEVTVTAFADFTPDEEQRCIARSNIIECAVGDRLLKAGGTARNMFVVLEGTLEARDDGRVVGVLAAGEAFGEMAFLLEAPRQFDVYAATAGVRVLSLSEGRLRKMIAEDPVVAAKLLLNLSKMLCVRLIRSN